MNDDAIAAEPFRPRFPGDAAALRDALQHAGFTQVAVEEVLDRRNERMVDAAVITRRTATPSAFHTLVRLFVLNAVCDAEAVRVAVAPVAVEELIAAGLCARDGDGLRATARLMPWRHLFLLSDFLPPAGEPLPHGFVMGGTSASSAALVSLTPRRRVGSVLDIGTGCGIHALLAAAHADRVTATDANPRALNFAAMNAHLNGIANVSFAVGSFFEPVKGQAFDLIVCNPPFVIAPPSDLLYQSAGLFDDAVSELVVRQAPAHLNEGGVAVVLVSWHYRGEDDWPARPYAWAARAGCDFMLLRTASDSPLDYAANALRQTEQIASPQYATMLDQWTAYYRAQDMTRLAVGAAVLRRRRAQENWTRAEIVRERLRDGAGEQVERIFAAGDLLATAKLEEMLEWRLKLAPDHVVEQQFVPSAEGWESRSLILMAERGMEHRAAIDARVMAFLAHCDGRHTVREAIAAMARTFDLDLPTAVERGLPIVRGLLQKGMLVAA